MRRLAVLFGRGDFLLALAVALGGCFLLLYLIFGCDNLYRDVANCYADMVRHFASGDLRNAFHPSLPVLNIFLAGLAACCGMEAAAACVLVSGLFFVATVPLVYLLVKQFAPAVWAGWGALLFVCTPRIIQMGFSGMLDTAKIFFLVLAVLCLVRLVRKPFPYRYALLLGLALGGMSLARSEGVLNAAAVIGISGLFWLWLAGKKQLSWGGAAARLALSVLPWIALLLPKCWVNWLTAGEWVFDRRLANGLIQLLGEDAVGASSPVAIEIDFASFLSKFANGSYGLYLGFALAGMLALGAGAGLGARLWRGRRPEWAVWRPEYWILIGVVVSNAVLHFASIAAWRYFMLNGPVLMVFTVAGFAWLICVLPAVLKPWLPLLLGAVVLTLQVAKGLEDLKSDPNDDYHIGLWLRDNMPQAAGAGDRGVRVFFRDQSPIWYWTDAERAWPIEMPPPDLAAFDEFDLVIWGEREGGAEILRGRSDLERVPLPFDRNVTVYRKAGTP